MKENLVQLSTDERRNYIISQLYEDNSSGLSFDIFSTVSDQTLHNDGRWFRENGYSIAVESRKFIFDVLWSDTYAARSRTHVKQKYEIGKCVASLLINGEIAASVNEPSATIMNAIKGLSLKPQRVVALDAGSTNAEIASAVSRIKIPTRNLSMMRVVTNSPHIARIVTRISPSGHRVTIIGGNLRVQTDSICGTLAIRSLNSLKVKADISIVGATSFDLENGFCCNNEDEAEIKSHILSMGRIRCIAIDSKKLVESEKAAAWSFAAFSPECVDIIVTDSEFKAAALRLEGCVDGLTGLYDRLVRSNTFIAYAKKR